MNSVNRTRTYARNVNNIAVDVVTDDPSTLFHPDIACQFIVVPDGTLTGAIYVNNEWTNPLPMPVPAETESTSPNQSTWLTRLSNLWRTPT